MHISWVWPKFLWRLTKTPLQKLDPYAFPFFGNVDTSFMDTSNILGLHVGLLFWLWSTPNIPNVLEDLKWSLYFKDIKWVLIVLLIHQRNLGFLFLFHLVIRNIKRKERGRIRRRIVLSMSHHQPLCRKSFRFISSCNLLKQKTGIDFYSLQWKPIKIDENNIRQEEDIQWHIRQ